MRKAKLAAALLCADLAAVSNLRAQAASPDVLVFTDGEKLIGHLESATGSSVVFKSDMAGEVTVEWTKIQELHSSQKFAAIPTGVKLRHREDTVKVPRGTLAVTGQPLEIDPGPAGARKTMPVGTVANVVDEAALQRAFERSGVFHGWTGSTTAGLSLTEATQKNQTVTAAVALVQTVPAVNWLDLRSRTIVDFTEAYGKLTQPGSPVAKTSLYHAGIEQDWYLRPRLFAFGHAIFDHSFSQGLDLQQTYGGGLGFVVFKRANQELDFKASADYIDQQFETASLNKHLFASTFGETYVRTFAHGILLNEQAGITPACNDTNAYSAFASAALTLPVYHRLGLTLGALDNFLNDPPPMFKKNSFQFTAGATYSLK